MPDIFVIAGPTASGKSGLALAMAQELGGVVINADSMQVYASFPILSAQPGDEARAAITHLLYGSVHAPAISTAASWRATAINAITDVIAAGKQPIVVGGTGLYLEALMHGISEIPDVPDVLREKIIEEYKTLGGPAFRDRLMKVDKAAAIRLPPGDSQRLIRAYAVYVATGKSLSHWQKEGLLTAPTDWNFKSTVLMPERDALYRRIDGRIAEMISAGAMDEVRNTPALDHPSQKALGVQEFQAFVRNETSWEEAVAKTEQHSHNYAKRQMTWFNNRFMKKEAAAGREVNIIK